MFNLGGLLKQFGNAVGERIKETAVENFSQAGEDWEDFLKRLKFENNPDGDVNTPDVPVEAQTLSNDGKTSQTETPLTRPRIVPDQSGDTTPDQSGDTTTLDLEAGTLTVADPHPTYQNMDKSGGIWENGVPGSRNRKPGVMDRIMSDPDVMFNHETGHGVPEDTRPIDVPGVQVGDVVMNSPEMRRAGEKGPLRGDYLERNPDAVAATERLLKGQPSGLAGVAQGNYGGLTAADTVAPPVEPPEQDPYRAFMAAANEPPKKQSLWKRIQNVLNEWGEGVMSAPPGSGGLERLSAGIANIEEIKSPGARQKREKLAQLYQNYEMGSKMKETEEKLKKMRSDRTTQEGNLAARMEEIRKDADYKLKMLENEANKTRNTREAWEPMMTQDGKYWKSFKNNPNAAPEPLMDPSTGKQMMGYAVTGADGKTIYMDYKDAVKNNETLREIAAYDDREKRKQAFQLQIVKLEAAIKAAQERSDFETTKKLLAYKAQLEKEVLGYKYENQPKGFGSMFALPGAEPEN